MTHILNGKTPVKCDSVTEWGEWFETANRQVSRTKARTNSGKVDVSTVFLGIDHAVNDEPPEFFETMIFGGEHDGEQWRYSTWDEAEKGHLEACKIAGV